MGWGIIRNLKKYQVSSRKYSVDCAMKGEMVSVVRTLSMAKKRGYPNSAV